MHKGKPIRPRSSIGSSGSTDTSGNDSERTEQQRFASSKQQEKQEGQPTRFSSVVVDGLEVDLSNLKLELNLERRPSDPCMESSSSFQETDSGSTSRRSSYRRLSVASSSSATSGTSTNNTLRSPRGSLMYPSAAEMDQDSLNVDDLFRQYQTKRLSPRTASSNRSFSFGQDRDSKHRRKSTNDMISSHDSIDESRRRHSSYTQQLLKAPIQEEDNKVSSEKLGDSHVLEFRKRPPPPKGFTTSHSRRMWQHLEEQQEKKAFQQSDQVQLIQNLGQTDVEEEPSQTTLQFQRSESPEDDDDEEIQSIHSERFAPVPIPLRPGVTRSYSYNPTSNSSSMGRLSSPNQRTLRRTVSVNSSSPRGGRPPLSSSASFSSSKHGPFRALRRSNSTNSQRSNKSSTEDLPLVEISDGVFAPLRGSDETREAFLSQVATVSIDCSKCFVPLICVADVNFVMCPTCRAITSNEQNSSARSGRRRRSSSCTGTGGGLALGVRENELLFPSETQQI